jgi:hypothetical protein
MSAGEVIAGAVTGKGTPPSLLQKLATGIDMPYWTLKLLTALPPTGMLGMNHAAMHNQPLAIMKAGSIALCILFITMFLPYYPLNLGRYIIYLSFFGPWFMFDILEVINSVPFKVHGFRLPLNITLEGLTTSKHTFNDNQAWKLTTPLLTAILAAFTTSGLVLANLIPANIIPASITNTIAIASGSTGLALGGVALALMVTSATSAVAPAAPAAPARGGSEPPIIQAGGGLATLPPLSSFADKIIQAKSPDESLAFLSVIVLIVLGGIFTASTKA